MIYEKYFKQQLRLRRSQNPSYFNGFNHAFGHIIKKLMLKIKYF